MLYKPVEVHDVWQQGIQLLDALLDDLLVLALLLGGLRVSGSTAGSPQSGRGLLVKQCLTLIHNIHISDIFSLFF